MAAETLPGGDTAKETLPDQLFNVVDGLFSDAQGGTATETQVGTTSLIVAKGPENQDKALLIPPTTNSVLTLPDLGVVVTVPAQVGLTFEGTQTSSTEQATNFLVDTAIDKIGNAVQAVQNSNADSAVIDATVAALNKILDSVNKGLEFLSNNAGQAQISKVNLVNVLDSSSTQGSQIKLDMGGSGDVLSAVNLSNVKSGNTVLVENADKLLVVGNGTIQISDNLNASVAGDSRAQVIIGGAGNDTLVGGGGADTLSGGDGANTFGLSATSQLTIADFDATQDKILITLPGVTDFNALKAAVVSGQYVNGNSVFTLSDGSEITLVGVDPNSLTSDLFTFNV